MRRLRVLATGLLFSLCACDQRATTGVRFNMRGHLRPVEWANVQQIPPHSQPNSKPDYQAIWTNGSARFVYLKSGDIVRFGRVSWEICAFDDAGELVEHNALSTDVRLLPLRLLSIAPLRVGFGLSDAKGVIEVSELAYSREEWRRYMLTQEDVWNNVILKSSNSVSLRESFRAWAAKRSNRTDKAEAR